MGWRTPTMVIVAGCVIAVLGFGVRSTFGLFLDPMTEARGWDTETFALAMAIQNLLWGVGAFAAGALADRFGPVKVIVFGALAYASGIYGMTIAESSLMLHLTGGILTGIGVAFTGFALVMAAMAKVVGPEKRSLILGLGTAAGSFGQVVFTPMGQAFIEIYGWSNALLLLAGCAMVVLPLAFILPNNPGVNTDTSNTLTMGQALQEALNHRGFVLLTIGFFVCGFHVAFIAVHFPKYVKELGLDPSIGALALSLVGLFNIAGSFMSGMFGQRWSKRIGLSGIYFLRAIAIFLLMIAPKTELTIFLFAGAMGILWLSTVPLTSGLVAQVFGVRYMASLFGIVFLGHQLGSFLGIWLGGYLFDKYGSYDAVWWAGVALGLMAAVVHLPIDERPVMRAPSTAGD
ncbi:MFS transporter [Hwanghaeella grinnelliae]|uniref:MFS transporter n=2 Tax=Hwanghaeella grinnelliae TaxID=2500179 RepID=A0A437QR10_9PROT|nr:MFS transporter [Hwanghaeella grinnelliae]